MSDEEREQAAAELRRVREGVRERALHERAPAEVLPPARPLPEPRPMPPLATPEPPPGPPRPDNAALNAIWDLARAALPGGLRGRLAAGLRALLRPLVEAQTAFNSRQVQFDNELLAWVEARLHATHGQYDEVLGIHRRHMAEIDERHLILQEELVAHVHDLVRRIDLVLADSERGRVGLETGLRDVRARLQRLEQRLSGGPPPPRE